MIAALEPRASEEVVEVCSVRVGETLFGAPIRCIVEILGAPAIHSVPLAPPYIAGLTHYRGEVLAVVSLRALLEMPPYERSSDVVVFQSADGYFGVWVDAVGEVVTALQEAFEAIPSTLDDQRKALFRGACKLPDRLLVMLDTDRLDPMRLSN